MDAEIWDGDVQQSGLEAIAMPGSARAFERSNGFEGRLESAIFKISNMADSPEQLGDVIKHLANEIHDLGKQKGADEVVRQWNKLKNFLWVNAAVLALAIGSGLIRLGEFNNRMTVLEVHDIQYQTTMRQITEIGTEFKDFQNEMRRTLERIEQQVDGPKRR